MTRARTPPPLLPTGLVLRRDGSFEHEGFRVTHRRLHRVLLRGVRFLEEEGCFVVQVGRFRGRIEVEDTPFWVNAYDPADGKVWLSDGTTEPLAPEHLSLDIDGVLRCRVKGRFPARFTQGAQADLFQDLEPEGEGWRLRMDERHVPVPGLAPTEG